MDDEAAAHHAAAWIGRHVTDQMVRVGRLQDEGRDTGLAEDVLATFVQMLDQHRAHRENIVKRIGYLGTLA